MCAFSRVCAVPSLTITTCSELLNNCRHPSLDLHHTRFGNGGMLLVAHISIWLFYLCIFLCELVCRVFARCGNMLLVKGCRTENTSVRIQPLCSSGFESTAREIASSMLLTLLCSGFCCCTGSFCAVVNEVKVNSRITILD